MSLGNTMRTVELNVSWGWRTWVMWAMFVLRMHMHQNALQMSYTLLKALHIIFVVTWFGLFYMFRLFVYHREAQDQTPGPVPRRSLPSSESWNVDFGLPSLALSILAGFGIGMLYHIPGYLAQPWLHVSSALWRCSSCIRGGYARATLRTQDAPWAQPPTVC